MESAGLILILGRRSTGKTRLAKSLFTSGSYLVYSDTNEWQEYYNTQNRGIVEGWLMNTRLSSGLRTLILDMNNLKSDWLQNTMLHARHQRLRIIVIVQYLRQVRPLVRPQVDWVFSLGSAEDSVYDEFVNKSFYSREDWRSFPHPQFTDESSSILLVDCKSGRPHNVPSAMPELVSDWRDSLRDKSDTHGSPTCSVCLENVKCVALGCSHAFCVACTLRVSLCPLCRANIESVMYFRL